MIKYPANVLPLLLLYGCVTPNYAQIRAQELSDQIAAMPQKKKDDFIRKFGPPQKCAALSSGELCDFIRDLGISGGGYAVPIGYGMIAAGNDSHRAYELIRCEFDTAGNFVHRSIEVRY